jgi:hypothetical protein
LTCTIDQALVHQIMLNDQPSPTPRNFKDLQTWLEHPRGGNSDLRGPGSLTWQPQEDGGRPRSDQIALASESAQDSFLVLWIENWVLPLLPQRLTKVGASFSSPNHWVGNTLTKNSTAHSRLMALTQNIRVILCYTDRRPHA